VNIDVHIGRTKDGTIAVSVYGPENAPRDDGVQVMWELIEQAVRGRYEKVVTHFVPVKAARKVRRS
jgi:hypothetical protein